MIVGIFVGNIVVTLKNINKAYANIIEKDKLMFFTRRGTVSF